MIVPGVAGAKATATQIFNVHAPRNSIQSVNLNTYTNMSGVFIGKCC